MKPTRRIYKYALTHFYGVKHTTLNPEGPGVVRLHLIPPEFSKQEIAPSLVIINGQDIVPVNVTWTILLMELFEELNQYHGKEIGENEAGLIVKNTARRVRKVYPFIRTKRIKKDIRTIFDTFFSIAEGKTPDAQIGYMNIGQYAPYMKAPHRMDLMISAMTKDDHWHCNQKCVHCYAAGQVHGEEAELSTGQWKEILKKLQEIGIPQVTFTGGEPTMRSDLVELVDAAQWFVTRLNTNGILLTPKLCRELMDASLDSVQITFYSAEKEIHNQLVGAGQYDNTVAGIENALNAGLNVSINTPLCTLNQDYVKTLEFLHEKGILYVTCSGLITTGNAATEASASLQLTHDKILQVLTDAVRFCFDHGMEISFTSPGWLENEVFEALGIMTPGCGACLSNMAITPSGNVVPCQSWLSGATLGNILENDWNEIWTHKECKKRRDFSAQMLGKCPLRIQGKEDM